MVKKEQKNDIPYKNWSNLYMWVMKITRYFEGLGEVNDDRWYVAHTLDPIGGQWRRTRIMVLLSANDEWDDEQAELRFGNQDHYHATNNPTDHAQMITCCPSNKSLSHTHLIISACMKMAGWHQWEWNWRKSRQVRNKASSFFNTFQPMAKELLFYQCEQITYWGGEGCRIVCAV